MPNRCNNSLIVRTKVHPRRLFKKVGDQYVVHFNKIVPIYKKSGKLIEDSWLWWWRWDQCVEKRWTKRDVDDSSYAQEAVKKDGIREFFCYFDSAWAPPIGYYNALWRKMQSLDPNSYMEAIYSEPGMWFCGKYTNWRDDTYWWDDVHFVWDEWVYIVTDPVVYEILSETEWDDNVFTIEEFWNYFKKEDLSEEDKEFVLSINKE